MYCHKCGTQNLDAANFCKNCGEVLFKSNVAPDERPNPDQAVSPVAELNSSANASDAYNASDASAFAPYNVAPSATIYAPYVNTHLAGNIVATILCCNPVVGVVGIVFSVLSRNALQKGDFANAKSFSIAALVAFWANIITAFVTLVACAVPIAFTAKDVYRTIQEEIQAQPFEDFSVEDLDDDPDDPPEIRELKERMRTLLKESRPVEPSEEDKDAKEAKPVIIAEAAEVDSHPSVDSQPSVDDVSEWQAADSSDAQKEPASATTVSGATAE